MMYRVAAVVLATLMLASCGRSDDRTLQGWVEADLIFVSPDESGRVENLAVREGDRVDRSTLLFTVDDDLQKADLAIKQAALSPAGALAQPFRSCGAKAASLRVPTATS